jgi:hypothetical protein
VLAARRGTAEAPHRSAGDDLRHQAAVEPRAPGELKGSPRPELAADLFAFVRGHLLDPNEHRSRCGVFRESVGELPISREWVDEWYCLNRTTDGVRVTVEIDMSFMIE